MNKTYQLIIESMSENSNFSSNDLSPETPIFGKNSNFDSLDLVTFLVSLEQKIEDEMGVNITIADEKAMSLKNSPFRTIETLTNFLNGKLEHNE